MRSRKPLAPVAGDEGPEHQEGRRRDRRVRLVGRQHPVDQLVAVAAAAGGDQHEGALGELRIAHQVRLRRHVAAEIAGIDDAPLDMVRQVEPRERLVDLLEPVDPDVVVEVDQGIDGALALPLRPEHVRVVHDVAHPEDDARARAIAPPPGPAGARRESPSAPCRRSRGPARAFARSAG